VLARGQSIKDFQKSILISGRPSQICFAFYRAGRFTQIIEINILKINIIYVYPPALPERLATAGRSVQSCPPSLPDIRQAGGRRVCILFMEIISFPITLSEPRPFLAIHLVSTDQASLQISFCQNAASAF